MTKFAFTSRIDRSGKIRNEWTLPMSGADASQSESIAAGCAEALNAQLDFAKSPYRLRPVNVATGEVCQITKGKQSDRPPVKPPIPKDAPKRVG